MRPGRAADHSPTYSAAVMEEYSYTSTHPLGHNRPVTGSLYLCVVLKAARARYEYVRVEDHRRRATGLGQTHGGTPIAHY